MNKILLFLLLGGLVTGVHAQSGISFSAGIKTTNSDQRPMSLLYVDESPSGNELFKEFQLSGRKTFDLSIRMQGTDGRLNPFLEGQFYFGNLTGLTGGLGLSYALPSERKTRVIPEISGIVGISSYNLGRLESEDAYVQVNKVRFMEYSSPDVDFQTLCVGLKPGISFLVDAGGNRAFGIRLAYQLSLKFGYLNFTGMNENGDDTGATESLSARNIDFKVNGVRTSKSPFNPDGVEINLFYCY